MSLKLSKVKCTDDCPRLNVPVGSKLTSTYRMAGHNSTPDVNRGG